MNLSYNNNEPAANNNPSNSQGPMLTNTKSINSWVDIDHHGFGDPIGGYHKIIHQDTASPVQRTVNRSVTPNTFTGFPSAITGINQLFAANVIVPSSPGPTMTDTQLFSITGNGGISQLTGNFAQGEGYMWVSGILVQWGTVISSIVNVGNTLIFSSRAANMIAFPNALFTVITTPRYSSTPTVTTPNSGRVATVSIDLDTTATSKTQFTWAGRTSSTTATNNYSGFSWIAIGN